MQLFIKFLLAFIIGGLICVIAQILLDKTNLAPARILVLFVVLGVFFGAIGLYTPLIELAGAGATTPISGFGNVIAQGVRDAVDRQGLLGALTGPLCSASAGITASLIFSFLASLIFKGKGK